MSRKTISKFLIEKIQKYFNIYLSFLHHSNASNVCFFLIKSHIKKLKYVTTRLCFSSICFKQLLCSEIRKKICFKKKYSMPIVPYFE